MYLSSLIILLITSWSLSGTWLTGVLAAVYAVVNRFSVSVAKSSD